MGRAGFGGSAAWSAICAIVLLAVHWPGHSSYDTLAQLRDGLSRSYASNQPPAMSWLVASALQTPLGFGALLAINIGLWGWAGWLIHRLLAAQGVRWPGLALLVWWLFPVSFLYTGILWKDVLAAHLATLAFLLVIPRPSQTAGAGALAMSALAIAAAALVRQQMALMIPLLGAAAWFARSDVMRGHRSGIAAAWLVGVLALSWAADAALTRSARQVSGLATQGAVYQLTTFDLAGIRSHGGQLRLAALDAAGVDRQRLFAMLDYYGADRVDRLGVYPTNPLMSLADPNPPLLADWRASIRANPIAYAAHRWEHFSWQAGLRGQTQCLPYQFGVEPLPAGFPALSLPSPRPERDARLRTFAASLLPLFRPALYAAVSVLALALLAWRRPLGWTALAMFQFAGLAYLGSYLLIGIACDFRYAYFLVPVALTGALSVWLPATRTGASPR
mgnify:CR=1 FL=1